MRLSALPKITIALASGLALSAANFTSAPMAQAAGCSVYPVEHYRAFNNNCTWGQHYQLVGSRATYGSRVGPQSWSDEGFCVPGSVGRARSSGVRTNAV